MPANGSRCHAIVQQKKNAAIRSQVHSNKAGGHALEAAAPAMAPDQQPERISQIPTNGRKNDRWFEVSPFA
jgi:hypothetical protein